MLFLYLHLVLNTKEKLQISLKSGSIKIFKENENKMTQVHNNSILVQYEFSPVFWFYLFQVSLTAKC